MLCFGIEFDAQINKFISTEIMLSNSTQSRIPKLGMQPALAITTLMLM